MKCSECDPNPNVFTCFELYGHVPSLCLQYHQWLTEGKL
jgi:hypothetical protein